nr:E-beta-farnesene synthase [Tanacetum cinerariifolium]
MQRGSGKNSPNPSIISLKTKNLAHHTHRKKKAILIVISSIRFTKLIIYYLQRKHKFHPRPDSPHHLPNEEPVLRYLKFSAKGTKREVFGMPTPNNLITADIQGEPYYKEYLEKVAKHQRYLASEKRSDPDSPAPKPAKATKKSKTFDDEEADVQRALEEILKSVYNAPRGLLLPMVIREPVFGKYQLLLETPKKKSPADQYIFQRRTSTPTESSGHDKSSSLYSELRLTDSEVESDEDLPGIDAGTCVIFELSLRSSSIVDLLVILVVEYCLLSTVTELVDLIEPHDHLNSIYVPKCDGSWRVDYCVVVLIFKADGIPFRFGEVELSLVAFNPLLEVFYALSDN